MNCTRPFFAVFFCLFLAACSYKPGLINEYKIDVQQGNVLTQEMVAQLRPGQTRDQVRFVLGSPVIADIFHAQRWDYVYSYRNGQNGATESRKLAVFFDRDGRLERIGGEVAGASAEELAAPVAKTRLVDLGTIAEGTVLPPREQPGDFRRFMNMLGL